MEHQLTITLPDALYQPLVEAALKEGRTPEEFVLEQVAQAIPVKVANGEPQKKDDITRFFGMWDSGDPNSADNERIDADLAREYGRGLDGDE
jgi:hypothetical protein